MVPFYIPFLKTVICEAFPRQVPKSSNVGGQDLRG